MRGKTTGSWEQFHDGIIDQASDLGYRVEEFWLRAPGMNEERLGRILRYRGIRGVMVLNHPESPAMLTLDWAGLVAVALGRTLARPGLPAVDHDHFGGMNLALDALAARNYRRVGLALFDDWSERERTNHQWEAAFALQQQILPAARRVPVFVGLRSDTARLIKWSLHHRPDAVVSDYPWALDLLSPTGKDAPGAPGFACLMWRSAEDRCAGVDMNCVEAARIATHLLHAQLGRQ